MALLTLTLPDDLYERLERMAQARGMTVEALCVEIITEYVRRLDEEEAAKGGTDAGA